MSLPFQVQFYVEKPMRLAGRSYRPGDTLDLFLENARRHEASGFGRVLGERRGGDGPTRVVRIRLLQSMQIGATKNKKGDIVSVDAATAESLVECEMATYELETNSGERSMPASGAVRPRPYESLSDSEKYALMVGGITLG